MWIDDLDQAVMFAPRLATISLGVLGIMGAMVAITGIFGMAAYSVSKRLKELGIRVALGAQRTELLQAALGRPLKLLAIGSAAGLLLGPRCWLSSSIRPRPAIRWYWLAWFWRCCCWAS
jgi:ABC-type lipoprotein release transport system permease subunit